MLREAIRAKLIDGEPAYEGSYGKCYISKVKKTEINPEKVRKELPSIADLVISEHVERARLISVMKEQGIEDWKQDLVMDIIGYTDRMTLTLKDPE